VRTGCIEIAAAIGLGWALVHPSPARADACLQEAWDDGTVQPMTLYPNWFRVRVATDVLWMYDGVPGTELIRGITVANFGTATGADFAAVYVNLECGATNSGFLTLTYAGVYPSDAGPVPAWTWAGSTVDFSGCPDLCGTPGCGGWFSMNIYVDVAPCPANGATVRMGIPSNGFLGGVTDSQGCRAPTGPASGSEHAIRYVFKQGPASAAPGDTVRFTIFYGRAGSGSLGSITVLDSLPPYTHYLAGSATPAPDPGWDPDPGPPTRLRWTIPGPLATAGGPTGSIAFSATVDWGNGELFEPGSGDVAAPEGSRLANRASATFSGAACSVADSNPAQTVVKRFRMWMIGDNDVLFSPTFGQPADEVTYDIFIKNLSATRTWWDVRVWDTVPPELDSWCVGCGFEDPCVGWTMTPTGCAAATPGKSVAGGNTILTWRLDMPPGTTVAMRWRAKVRPSATAGATAVNVLSVLALGKTGIVGGTGHSTSPANFAHLASIILPTTYISYVAFSGDRWAQPDSGDALTMFPLHKRTQFELRGLNYYGGLAGTGGVSASIGCLLGDCIGGFPGSAGSCPSGPIGSGASSIAGCKAERIPARFHHPTPLSAPYQHLYKITSNSPVAWQAQPALGVQCGDYHTYAPASTLSYAGLIHYFWKNSYSASLLNSGTEMFFMNTGKTPSGGYDPTLPTTVHVFRFNYGSNGWDYITTYDLGGESGAMMPGTILGEEGPYRSLSSQGQLIVWQGYQAVDTLGCGCPCFDISTMMPVRETGNVVGFAGQTFYGVTHGSGRTPRAVIGNLGGADATYRVWVYVPDDTSGPAYVPLNLRGTSGTWKLQGTHIAPQGFLTALNPRIYPLDGTHFNNPGSSAYKVELLGGGPIQIHHGIKPFTGWGGGAVIHAVDGNRSGIEFWVNQSLDNDGTNGTSPELYSINAYAPKTGMVIQLDTDDGRLETYTTTGPDQAAIFIGFAAPARKRNIRIRRLTAGALGTITAQYLNAGPEKGFTAPFLLTGVHYNVIMPPVVFSGQSFWITVIVVEQGGDTKTDYCGTASFTSTDPTTAIGGIGLDSYDYAYPSSVSGCNGGSPVNGVKVFVNVVMTKLGTQSIVVTDTLDGSISGVGATLVVGADVKLEKRPPLSLAASGDTLRFQICWSNFSSASADNFTITDAVPQGTTFVPEMATALDCGNTRGVTPVLAWSTATSPTPPASWSSGNPGPGTRWLRWTVPQVGVNTTGCVCFRVSVN
jgi:uncharacterized repeat protein (TIGR01451 family)